MRVLVLMGLLFPCFCLGEGFPLLEQMPESVWAYGEVPEKNIYDAVIVLHKTKFDEDRIHHYRLIRIFSERGKNAAKLFVLPKSLVALRGRVIDREGGESKLKRPDLIEVLQYATSDTERSTRILLPPGLTGDCIVELAWSERAENALPLETHSRNYAVVDRYFTVEKEFLFNMETIGKLQTRVWDLATRFYWTKIAPPAQFEQKIYQGYTVLSYTNVPAREEHPYGMKDENEGAAFVRVFLTLPFREDVSPHFWNDFGQQLLAFYYDPYLARPPVYLSWIKQLKERMPQEGDQRLAYMMEAFKSRISYVDQLTIEDLERIDSKVGDPAPLHQIYLKEVMERGYIYRERAPFFLLTMCRDVGLPAQLLFTATQGETFVPDQLNPFVLDIFAPLIGLREGEGRWRTVAPASPEYQVGTLPPRYRGVTLLAVDPYNKFSSEFTQLPRLNHNGNQSLKQYKLEVLADGSCQVMIGEKGTGVFDAAMRSQLYRLSPVEQEELAQSQWRERLPDWRITSSTVKHAREPKERVTVYIKAVRRLDIETFDWFPLNPFPGATPERPNPDLWPKHRREPINLEYSMVQNDSSRITLPLGWSLRHNPSWTRENEVGKISVQVKTQGRVITVNRKVIFKTDKLPAQSEPNLKAFLSWMTDAFSQTLAVNRGEG